MVIKARVSFLDEQRRGIDRELLRVVEAIRFQDDRKLLQQALKENVLSGGKRLRSLLLCAVVASLRGRLEQSYLAACSLEMIHAFSLIHDDLPAMDDSNFRRGKPCCHIAYGEANAVLLGDLLQALAIEQLAVGGDYDADQRVQLIAILAKATGGSGLVVGQWLEFNQVPESIETVQKIHTFKTGVLFKAACEMGAVIANSTPKERLLVAKVGSLLGQCYQWLDDLSDEVEDRALSRMEQNICHYLPREEILSGVDKQLEDVRLVLLELSEPQPMLEFLSMFSSLRIELGA